jgi:hypothetical protein
MRLLTTGPYTFSRQGEREGFDFETSKKEPTPLSELRPGSSVPARLTDGRQYSLSRPNGGYGYAIEFLVDSGGYYQRIGRKL